MTFDLHVLLALAVILGLIALDFLVGVLKSLTTGTFSIQKLPGQLANFVLPFYTPLLVLGIVVFFAPVLNIVGVTGATEATFYTAAAAVGLKALADIFSKVGLTFGTTPAPVAPVEPAKPA